MNRTLKIVRQHALGIEEARRRVDQLADEYAEKGVKVGKVDIEAAPEIAAKFGITGVPTLIFFKGGEKVDQMVGAQPKSILEKKLDEIT